MFICPYDIFSYRRILFELYNASTTFERCMNVIFVDLIEDVIKIFMDDFYFMELLLEIACKTFH